MVTRREDEQDRRVKRVRLSEHGRAWWPEFVHAHREAVRECVEALDDHEREQLSAGSGADSRSGGRTPLHTMLRQGEGP